MFNWGAIRAEFPKHSRSKSDGDSGSFSPSSVLVLVVVVGGCMRSTPSRRNMSGFLANDRAVLMRDDSTISISLWPT